MMRRGVSDIKWLIHFEISFSQLVYHKYDLTILAIKLVIFSTFIDCTAILTTLIIIFIVIRITLGAGLRSFGPLAITTIIRGTAARHGLRFWIIVARRYLLVCFWDLIHLAQLGIVLQIHMFYGWLPVKSHFNFWWWRRLQILTDTR